MKHVAIIGHCFGNETQLDQCKHYVDAEGVKCKSNKAVALACQDSEFSRTTRPSEMMVPILQKTLPNLAILSVL